MKGYRHITENGKTGFRCTACRAASPDKQTLSRIPCLDHGMLPSLEVPKNRENLDWIGVMVTDNDVCPFMFPMIGNIWVTEHNSKAWVWTNFGKDGLDWKELTTGERRYEQPTLPMLDYDPQTAFRHVTQPISKELFEAASTDEETIIKKFTEFSVNKLLKSVRNNREVSVENLVIREEVDIEKEQTLIVVSARIRKVPEELWEWKKTVAEGVAR